MQDNDFSSIKINFSFISPVRGAEGSRPAKHILVKDFPQPNYLYLLCYVGSQTALI